jgi:hypothetical protein
MIKLVESLSLTTIVSQPQGNLKHFSSLPSPTTSGAKRHLPPKTLADIFLPKISMLAMFHSSKSRLQSLIISIGLSRRAKLEGI